MDSMRHPILKQSMRLKGRNMKTVGGYVPHSKLSMVVRGVKHKPSSSSKAFPDSKKRIKPLKFNF
jgi:hypothetical protein